MEEPEDNIQSIHIRKAKKLRWTHHHVAVFVLTFMCYALFHATRKTFSNVKATIEDEWTPENNSLTENETCNDKIWNAHRLYATAHDAELYLGVLDAIFLISYAIGLYISGVLGDRLNMRYVLTFGMCSSAVTVFVFGTITEFTQFYNIYFYGFVWMCNGLLQSTGWPCVVAVMANWFGKSSRGFVLGLWSSCASVGNIIGAFMVSSVLKFGYEYAFLVTSVTLFAGGIVVFFGLVTSPREVNLPEPAEDEDETSDVTCNDEAEKPLMSDIDESMDIRKKEPDHERPQAIGFFAAFLLPGVLPYSLAYACLKMVNYSFFFWLPYYLDNNFHWSQSVADDLSIWYDVGGIIGGIIAGLISDLMKIRSPICVFMLIVSFPSLYGYSISPATKLSNSFLMANVGFWIGGPANIISSAISADMGRQGPLKGNTEALATVTGIVDGTGSVGAALGQLIVPTIHDKLHLNWHYVFYFFIVMTFLSTVCIAPMLVRDVREVKGRCFPCCKCFHICRPIEESPHPRSSRGYENESNVLYN